MDRRQFISSTAALSLISPGGAALARTMAEQFATSKIPAAGTAEHVIFLWLGGGMAQIDTFDPKQRGDPAMRIPGSAYAAIDTAVSGVQVCEHLRRTADRMDRVTAIRTVEHSMIDEHAAAVYWVHVGRPVNGTIQYPAIGSVVAHQLSSKQADAPAYALIGYPNVARNPGFLGPKHGYVYLTDLESGPRGLAVPSYISEDRQSRRQAMLDSIRQTTLSQQPEAEQIAAYDAALEENRRLSSNRFMNVYDLEKESSETREAYGSEFGQRCLLARRLTERGTKFVEVAHNLNFVNGTGWDTHQEGQLNQWTLIRELDQALSALIDDLESRKRLDKTLIVVATEFGRPAEFDGKGGRGHQSTTFSVVLAGGGLSHCGALGLTDELSRKVEQRPVSIPDFHATIHQALGIDPSEELFDGNRPIPITDNGVPIAELFG